MFGHEFILLWAGNTYSDSYYIALLTLIPLSVPLIQNTGLAIVMAQNKHRFRSIIYLVIAIANVVSTYLVVPYLGAIGAALCSAISYILGQGIIMNIYYYKKTGIDIPAFWKNILKMSVVPGVCVVTAFMVKQWIQFDSWIVFFLGVIVYTIIYLFFTWLVSLNKEEKEIFMKPIKRIINKFKVSENN